MTEPLTPAIKIALMEAWYMTFPIRAQLSNLSNNGVTDFNIRGAGGQSVNSPSNWANCTDTAVRDRLHEEFMVVFAEHESEIRHIWEKLLALIPDLDAIRFGMKEGGLYVNGVFCRHIDINKPETNWIAL